MKRCIVCDAEDAQSFGTAFAPHVYGCSEACMFKFLAHVERLRNVERARRLYA